MISPAGEASLPFKFYFQLPRRLVRLVALSLAHISLTSPTDVIPRLKLDAAVVVDWATQVGWASDLQFESNEHQGKTIAGACPPLPVPWLR